MDASNVETLQWNFTFYWREITQLLRNCLKLHRATGKYIIYLISVKKKKKKRISRIKNISVSFLQGGVSMEGWENMLLILLDLVSPSSLVPAYPVVGSISTIQGNRC